MHTVANTQKKCILLPLDLGIRRRQDQRHVHVEVVRVLDAADHLVELALEVEAALRGHHEVVLELDRHALPHGVARVRPLGLRQGARRRLVGDARGHPLVEAPDVPLDLPVGVLHVLVREDARGERAVGRVGDEAVDALGEVLVAPLEDVRDVPPPVPLVLLEVLLDVPGRRAEDVRVVVNGQIGRLPRQRAAAVRAGIAALEVVRRVGPAERVR